MNKIIVCILILIHCLGIKSVFGQVSVNRPIQFISTGDSARIVNLYSDLSDSTSGINVKTLQNNGINYVTVTGNDTIKLNHPIGAFTLKKGMVFYFKSTLSNTGNVLITVDNVHYDSLLKKNHQPLRSSDILPNQIVAIGFDGSNFQYLNYHELKCPNGFIKVTDEYCIETSESPTATYWDAIVNCFNKNARFCNWGEWHYACVSLGTSLSNMTNNWEYTDDAANEVNMVRIVGSGSCNAAGNQNIPINSNKNYRCCYSLK